MVLGPILLRLRKQAGLILCLLLRDQFYWCWYCYVYSFYLKSRSGWLFFWNALYLYRILRKNRYTNFEGICFAVLLWNRRSGYPRSCVCVFVNTTRILLLLVFPNNSICPLAEFARWSWPLGRRQYCFSHTRTFYLFSFWGGRATTFFSKPR